MSINLDLYDDIEVPVNGSGAGPLDPNKIRLSVWTPTVDVVLKMLKDGSLELPGDITRSSFWDERAESRLLESLLIKIPLPAFYIDGSHEDRLLPLDGLHRLRALKRYMREEAFALRGLEYLGELEGKHFRDLKRPLQRRLEESSLTIHRIEAGTSEAAKFNIIRRVHSGSEPLSAQETRSLLYPGAGIELLRVLARHEDSRTIWGSQESRMADEETILLFFLGPHKEVHEGNLRDLLQKLNENPAFREEETQRYLHVLPRVKEILDGQRFKKALPRSRLLALLMALENEHKNPLSLIEDHLA